MTYLAKVAAQRQPETARILATLRTENWWVLGDALRSAAELSPKTAAPVIIHILSQMQNTTLTWIQSEVLVNALTTLAMTGGDGAQLVEGTYRVLSILSHSPMERLSWIRS